MGKRRRHREAGRKEVKDTGEDNTSAAEHTRNNPTIDVDADCLQYHTESEEETPQAVSDAQAEGGDEASEEDDDSESELILGETVDDESDVELSIEFFDPTPGDVLPIQNFLKKYEHSIPKQKTNVSARRIAEAVCSQTRVGTTIRVTDDETPIGFISCLNMRDHQQVLKPISKHLFRLCQASKDFEKFSGILKDTSEGVGRFEKERMGLVLCERVLNFPPLLVPKLLEALFCEIEWALEDEPTEKQREAFRFGWYLYITEVYYMKRNENREDARKNKTEKKKKRRMEDGETESISYTRVEDEAWHKYASASVTWNVPDDVSDKNGIKRKKMAMIVNASKIKVISQMVSDLVGFKGDKDHDRQATLENTKGGA